MPTQALAARLPRRVPPPFLSISLAFIGLGLVWRAAGENLGLPQAPGELIVVAALAIYAAVALLFIGGLQQPGAGLARDLARPAGRGSVPAGSEAMILAGTAILPFAPQTAPLIWSAGVFLHLWLAARLITLLVQMAPEDRAPSGFLVVPFCGLIVAPVGGAPMADEIALGAASIAEVLFWGSAAVYAVLLVASARQLLRSPPPPLLRPGAFVFAAPPAIAVVGYDKLHPDGVLMPLLFAFSASLIVLAIRKRDWLTEGGFGPTWASFTFPSVAFAAACLSVAGRWPNPVTRTLAALVMLVATWITVAIARRAWQAWREGRLPPV